MLELSVQPIFTARLHSSKYFTTYIPYVSSKTTYLPQKPLTPLPSPGAWVHVAATTYAEPCRGLLTYLLVLRSLVHPLPNNSHCPARAICYAHFECMFCWQGPLPFTNLRSLSTATAHFSTTLRVRTEVSKQEVCEDYLIWVRTGTRSSICCSGHLAFDLRHTRRPADVPAVRGFEKACNTCAVQQIRPYGAAANLEVNGFDSSADIRLPSPSYTHTDHASCTVQ